MFQEAREPHVGIWGESNVVHYSVILWEEVVIHPAKLLQGLLQEPDQTQV